MSATERLRSILDDRGIEYGLLGAYCTYVTVDACQYAIKDNYDDTLSIDLAGRYSPERAIDAMLGHGTTVITTVDDDGVGRSVCSECAYTVGEWFRFCPWCGSRFVRRERRHE